MGKHEFIPLAEFTHPMTSVDAARFLRGFWDNVELVRHQVYVSITIDAESMRASMLDTDRDGGAG